MKLNKYIVGVVIGVPITNRMIDYLDRIERKMASLAFVQEIDSCPGAQHCIYVTLDTERLDTAEKLDKGIKMVIECKR